MSSFDGLFMLDGNPFTDEEYFKMYNNKVDFYDAVYSNQNLSCETKRQLINGGPLQNFPRGFIQSRIHEQDIKGETK